MKLIHLRRSPQSCYDRTLLPLVAGDRHQDSGVRTALPPGVSWWGTVADILGLALALGMIALAWCYPSFGIAW